MSTRISPKIIRISNYAAQLDRNRIVAAYDAGIPTVSEYTKPGIMKAKKQLLASVTNFSMFDTEKTSVPWLSNSKIRMEIKPLRMQVIINFIAIWIFLLTIQVSANDISKATKLKSNSSAILEWSSKS